jgi:aminoglycoside phosphotransferase family enzyme/predicted kinase
MKVQVRQPGMPQHPVTNSDELRTLMQNLCHGHCFAHAVDSFQIIETHISCILLTGPYAYKFKKPVNLGFLDFSTPAQRHFYCEEELRLNQQLAPELYLGLAQATGELQHPALDGTGPLLEYAVKMHQFPEAQRLDHVADRGELERQHIDALAEQLAHFHIHSPSAPQDSSFGDPAEVRRPVLENFSQISALLTNAGQRDMLEVVRRWTEQALLMLQGDFAQRRHDGWIRECHGDLHLGNIALFEGRPTLFDRLEFSPALRWIDVMSDLAFLLMDLRQRGQHLLAMRLLNRYLEQTGDYLGLGVLRFYVVYRTMVRAKVAIIQAHQRAQQGLDATTQEQEFNHYLETAREYTRPAATAPLVISHGLSGSGKSWVSAQLAEALGAVRLRSDVERKRLFALQPTDRVPSAVGQGIYQPDISRETYRRLHAAAYMVLDAGCPVILDATFLDKEQRELMRRLAQTSGAPFIILDVRAPDEVLRARILARHQDRSEISDADLQVLEYQLAHHEPLGAEELDHTLVVDNDDGLDLEQLMARFHTMAQEQMKISP